MLGNRFFSNDDLAIDLKDDNSVTPNDPGDGDSGDNNLQNFPVITSAELSGTDLTLDGSLDTDGLITQYRIEFFGNVAGTQDATNGEGRYYLGETTVTTDGSGDATFSNLVLSGVTLSYGDFVTATATKIDNPGQVGVDDLLAYGDTSEFAANVEITNANTPPTISLPGSALNYTENHPHSRSTPRRRSAMLRATGTAAHWRPRLAPTGRLPTDCRSSMERRASRFPVTI